MVTLWATIGEFGRPAHAQVMGESEVSIEVIGLTANQDYSLEVQSPDGSPAKAAFHHLRHKCVLLARVRDFLE
jgi:hypothetical protein